jgi:hypothetical protein
MLAFRHFQGEHSGDNMAHHLYQTLKVDKVLDRVRFLDALFAVH